MTQFDVLGGDPFSFNGFDSFDSLDSFNRDFYPLWAVFVHAFILKIQLMSCCHVQFHNEEPFIKCFDIGRTAARPIYIFTFGCIRAEWPMWLMQSKSSWSLLHEWWERSRWNCMPSEGFAELEITIKHLATACTRDMQPLSTSPPPSWGATPDIRILGN